MNNDEKTIINKRSAFWQKGKSWYFAIIANIVTLALMELLFLARFDNQADLFMEKMLEGPHNAHLVFSSFILGKILLPLTSLTTSIPWYTYLQFLFVFVALIGISHVMLDRSYSTPCKVVLFLVLLFLGYEGYATPGYIKTACILTSAGIILLANSLLVQRKMLSIDNVLAVILLLIGSLYSFKVSMISLIINILVATVYYVIGNLRKTDPEKLIIKVKKILQYFLTIIVVILVSFGLHTLDRIEYKHSDPTGYVILTYRDSYENYLSNGFNPDDVKNKSLYTLNNKARAKMIALASGVNRDGAEDVLKKIDELTSSAKKTFADTISEFFKEIPVGLFSIGIFYLWLALAIIYSAYSKKRTGIIVPSAVIIIIGMFVLFMTYFWKTSWICFAWMVPAILPMLLSIKEVEKANWRLLLAFISVFFVVLYSVFRNTL